MTNLDRDRVIGLLTEVGDELRAAHAYGSIYVVGGSAMALAGYTQNRITKDVDAHIREGHGQVIEAVRKVGRRHGLPGSWLNEQATPYLSRLADPDASTVFEHSNLIVTAASPTRLLAMKLKAGRAQDVDDSVALIGHTKIAAESLRDLVVQTFGPDSLTERVQLNIEIVVAAIERDSDTYRA